MSIKNTSQIFNYQIIVIILLLSLYSCSKDSTSPENNSGSQENINGKLVRQSECGGELTTAKAISLPDNQSGIEYSYDGESILQLKHRNSGFNCCPEITADFKMLNDTIIIEEKESGAMCHCLCLYDLEFEITDLSPGVYFIKVIELYTEEGDDLLEFEVTLGSSGTVGNYNVDRDHYPWNMGEESFGSLKSHSGCGGYPTHNDDLIVPPDSQCLIYEYDNTNTLLIRHQNATFNCCVDSLTAEVNVNGNVITISNESEFLMGGGCDCLCRYDLNVEIINILPGDYIIELIRPFSNDTIITQYPIDLVNEQSGYYCFGLPTGIVF